MPSRGSDAMKFVLFSSDIQNSQYNLTGFRFCRCFVFLAPANNLWFEILFRSVCTIITGFDLYSSLCAWRQGVIFGSLTSRIFCTIILGFQMCASSSRSWRGSNFYSLLVAWESCKAPQTDKVLFCVQARARMVKKFFYWILGNMYPLLSPAAHFLNE